MVLSTLIVVLVVEIEDDKVVLDDLSFDLALKVKPVAKKTAAKK